MSAAWAAVLIAAIAAAAALGRQLLASGERDGKIDACLAQLTKIADDHEERLRLLEEPPGAAAATATRRRRR
jgi:hypothetical protein